MAVVGFDFGSLHSKIGVARHRGIDIIANEVSNRATPSLVAFGPKQRQIGESAKTQETANFKNTIGSLKRLAGRTFKDSDIQTYEKKFINAELLDVTGSVGVNVSYLGERKPFTATQLVGAYFGKLRDITSKELKAPVSDVVIAVPGWFTDPQRRAIIDAAVIANLNVLRLINESTAVAIGYGITKSDLPEPENPRHVAFVDVGHSSLSVSIVAFSKGQLKVVATAYDRNLGGRDIDYALVQHFAGVFKEKYKIDILSSPKATFRLAAGCEKLKKVLSANAEAPLNVESIMNDVDVSAKLHRDEYEGLIASVLERIAAPCAEALASSGLTLEQIDAVELVGGSTRIPAVRAQIQSVFTGKTLSATLNQDEAVARGATFACAMLSPTFRVRDFGYSDINYYPIKLVWEASPDDAADEDTELLVFDKGNGIPSTKILTFHRNQPFHLEATYSHPQGLPGSMAPWIARFQAKSIPEPSKTGEPSIVKVKTRLDSHGILSFSAAYTEELEEKEVEGMEVDGEPKKTKKVVKKKDVPFIASNSALDSSLVNQYKEVEAEMHASDKLVVDTEDRKNALEEYVYDTRSKLDERFAAFVQPEEKEKLLAALQVAEDWLYTEEGEEATKSAYVERLEGLHALGKPIEFRWREAEDRRSAIAQLRETINSYMNQATGGDERFSHIDPKDLNSIVEKCATIQKWLEDQNVRQSERAKNVDPVLTTADITKKRDEIVYFATPILTKPKPKAPKADPPPTTDQQAPPTDGGAPPPPPKDDVPMDGQADGQPEMDVD